MALPLLFLLLLCLPSLSFILCTDVPTYFNGTCVINNPSFTPFCGPYINWLIPSTLDVNATDYDAQSFASLNSFCAFFLYPPYVCQKFFPQCESTYPPSPYSQILQICDTECLKAEDDNQCSGYSTNYFNSECGDYHYYAYYTPCLAAPTEPSPPDDSWKWKVPLAVVLISCSIPLLYCIYRRSRFSDMNEEQLDEHDKKEREKEEKRREKEREKEREKQSREMAANGNGNVPPVDPQEYNPLNDNNPNPNNNNFSPATRVRVSSINLAEVARSNLAVEQKKAFDAKLERVKKTRKSLGIPEDFDEGNETEKEREERIKAEEEREIEYQIKLIEKMEKEEEFKQQQISIEKQIEAENIVRENDKQQIIWDQIQEGRVMKEAEGQRNQQIQNPLNANQNIQNPNDNSHVGELDPLGGLQIHINVGAEANIPQIENHNSHNNNNNNNNNNNIVDFKSGDFIPNDSAPENSLPRVSAHPHENENEKEVENQNIPLISVGIGSQEDGDGDYGPGEMRIVSDEIE